MKTIMSIITLMIISSVSWGFRAGPNVSGGVPPHPALTTMSIEKPIAGVDFPTDSMPQFKAVLALYNGIRIPLLNGTAQLVQAEAGVEYPTDAPAPQWSQYQKVLVFQNKVRLPVLLSLQGHQLIWELPTGSSIDVSQIVSITSYENYVVISSVNGEQIHLQ